ncbi:probable LRR receptor-like serine/threonine-protein kinase At1g56140 [Pistacia vera]|uniref:probable LRR receptor-like serine/threonine-protein kinase At1g56140 n=1 Tax=Pistacia vera TaxID=55513 RepID=UPI0012635E52|nr:probable LRR receptor-like serine/threonine-protein kinase At1g56140 [Pistacia vera]
MAMILVELLVLFLIPKNWQLVVRVCFLMDNLTLNVQNIGSQVTGTAGPKLYQSSRQSSGSLRFYGLHLENGLHNVSLSFAETVFGDQGSQKWMSLGRHVFDIYIQDSPVKRF